jgi:putative VirB-like lipoprotein
LRRPAVAIVALVLLAGCSATGDAEEEGVKGSAVTAAKAAYEKARLEGRDLSKGPCIADPLPVPNWVADIAHDPRQPVDDEPENQCSTYRSGEAEHFVELDPEGHLIRAE